MNSKYRREVKVLCSTHAGDSPLILVNRQQRPMATIEQELRDYILGNYIFDQRVRLGDTDSFMELGIIDSTGVLELVSYVEERYAIKIDSEELIPENLDSIENVSNFIRRKLACGRAQEARAIGPLPESRSV